MKLRNLCMALVLGLGACAIHPATDPASFAAQTGRNSFEFPRTKVEPQDTLLLPVTHDRQVDGAACGAHALASLINYWEGAGTVTGAQMFAEAPPADAAAGYSIAEVMTLAQGHGLLASAVRMPADGLIAELEAGRPVMVPVSVPSVYVQPWQLPGANVPVLGVPADFVTTRTAWLSERLGQSMLNHYVLVAGYDGDTFIVMEPVMGLRTISAERLERYRAPFGNAAVVFSLPARTAN
ncbi:MAG: hypothetical protein IPK75_19360 [Acidobacteria bacterium]|nr:hypothetical protein [Acidobacteriota bacterium]